MRYGITPASRIGVCVWLGVLCLAAPARGEWFAVTIKGQMTYAFWQDVPIGSPFTISYRVETTDHDPNPLRGEYTATNATLSLINREIVAGGPNAEYTVRLGNGFEKQFSTYVDGNTAVNGLQVSASCVFPPNTLLSDAFPLELPVTSASIRNVRVLASLLTWYEGRIESYETAPVPEPGSAGVLAALAPTLFFRHLRPGGTRRSNKEEP